MVIRKLLPVALAAVLFFFASCTETERQSDTEVQHQMSLIDAKESGISFSNDLTESWYMNILNFGYMYTGAGVAIGDINGDGLSDIYLVGNMVPDKLYLNKGEMKFEDVTESAGITDPGAWNTGVLMGDFNGDTHLDIYICRGSHASGTESHKNLLFVNQGDGTFVEQAAFRGIDDRGYTMMAAQLDVDGDGDLDLYVMNRPETGKRNTAQDLIKYRNDHTFEYSDHLYINDGKGFYTEESETRGINSNFNYGLGLVTADLNNDDLIDIYVANDFLYNDLAFLNQGEGQFEESIRKITNHNAFFAMGTDIADLDGDGYEDILNVEMLPSDYWRAKVTMAPMVSVEKYENYFEKLEFHVQYMHNVFQWNRGNGFYSEIAQQLGIAKTDWSWACLMEDLDNDGDRDVFVSNGYRRDMYDNDAEAWGMNKLDELKKDPSVDLDWAVNEALEKVPSNPLSNYMYRNDGDFQLVNVAEQWKMAHKGFSNGTSLGDLDNDGDLDMVVNNINGEPFIYRNDLTSKSDSYIRLKLNQSKSNFSGIGAKVTVKAGEKSWYEQFKTVRGYLSTLEPIMHIGLGDVDRIDEIEVIWPNQTRTVVKDVAVNQVLELTSEGAEPFTRPELSPGLLSEVEDAFNPPYVHQENYHEDYKNQVLLPHKLSENGPAACAGDLNGDGLDDFYVGGASGYPGAIYLGQKDGTFSRKNSSTFTETQGYEDVDAIFFDADTDGDLDLYVVSGGSEYPINSEAYQDRIYLNDGNGGFSLSKMLPPMTISGGCVSAADIDKDGDQDLFVGGRLVPDLYPYPSHGIILRNDGGQFSDITKYVAPELLEIGMITDATWQDMNGDGISDLVMVGEWMPITIFEYSEGRFVNKTKEYGLDKTTGWWFTVEVRDIDGDGDQDVLAGNLGKNYKHKASKEKPFHVYSHDFDQNGTYDVVLAKYDGDRQVPVRGRQCTSEQMPGIKEAFPTYRDFAEAGVDKILGGKKEEALHMEVYTFASMILERTPQGYEQHKMPFETQISTLRSIVFDDINGDGKEEMITGGNMFPAEPETTRADASIGLVLEHNGGMDFRPMHVHESGLFIPYDVRKLLKLKGPDNSSQLLVVSNNSKLRLYGRSSSL